MINGVLAAGNEDKSNSNDNLKSIAPQATLKVTGLAAFKADKLLGWLEGSEAVGAALMKNKIKQMPLLVQSGKGNYVAFNVYLSQVDIEAEVANPVDPLIKINITQQAGLKESPNDLDLTKPEVLNSLSLLVEKETRRQINAAISEARKMKSDFLGFGEAVERENPQGWKTVENHWDTIFTTCRVQLDVDVIIRHTDMRSSSFQAN